MTKTGALIIALIGSILSGISTLAAEPKPLFADETSLKITLTAPFSDLISKARKSTKAYPATLTVLGAAPEDHAITLSARGNSRRTRGFCNFPPLRVRFGDKASGQKPADTSLFKGQKNLKLVTHCKRSDINQQYLFLEYAAYTMLNIVTDESMRVRLAEIDYIEADSGKTRITRTGFFIEDMDDVAKRMGRKEIDVEDISPRQLAAGSAAQISLFHYMIGNLDWSASAAVDGAMCCHNTKLMGDEKTSATGLIAVPYDFDHSGLVDAGYATPPDVYNIRSVKTRIFKGYCAHNDRVRRLIPEFLSKKSKLMNTLEAGGRLNKTQSSKAQKYLQKFFDILEDPKKTENRLFKKCI